MSGHHNHVHADPAFEALLRRAAALRDLAPEQDRRIRARLGLPVASAQTATATATTVAPRPVVPRDSVVPAPNIRRSRRRQWVELALGAAAIALVAVALAAIFRGMDGDSPQSPGVGASPEAQATATSQPADRSPTPGGAPSIEYAAVNMWQTGIGSPGDIEIGPDGLIYIVDSQRDVVRRFTASGTPDGTYEFRRGDQIGNRDDIAIGPDGSLWVLDTSPTPRVLRFTPDGTLVSEWGDTVSFEPGSVFGAWSIAVDADGFVFVADGQSRLQKFTSDGELVDWWDRAGEYLFPSNARQMQVYDGSLYVLASGYRMPDNLSVILRFDLDGNLDAEPLVFGDQAAGLGFRPSSFAVGPDGSLFVTDPAGREVVRLTLAGEVLTRWTLIGSPGSAPEAFPLAVAPDGAVYVAHGMRQLAQVFAPLGPGGESAPLTPTSLPASTPTLSPTETAPPESEPTPAATPDARATMPTENVRLVVDEGAWLLIVTEHEGQYGAGVLFGSESAGGVIAYAEAVRSLGPQAFENHDTVPVLITFSQPVSFEYANQLLQESGTQARSFQVRTFTPDGQRATTGMPANADGTLSPQEGWERRRAAGEGIFDIEAVIDRSAWEALNNDPFVYLVDVMRAIAADLLAEHGIDGVAIEDVGVNSPYWLMEDYGIVPPEG